MRRFSEALLLSAVFASTFATTARLRPCFSRQAVPGVGTTVRASPSELRLTFTQNIVAGLFGRPNRKADGRQARSERKAGARSGAANVLHVRLGIR